MAKNKGQGKKQDQDQQPQVDRRRLDVAQTAQRLGVSRSTVYRLIHHGHLKAAAFGLYRGMQVWQSSVEEYEKQKAEEAANSAI